MQENNYEREIYRFLNSYFKEINEISEFHLNFFIKNEIQTIDSHILILQKFIFQAMKFLETNGDLSFSKFLMKLYKDTKNLLEFLSFFQKKSRVVETIFENEFLNNLPEYRLLVRQIEDTNQILQSTSTRITSLETEIKFFNAKTKNDFKELRVLKGKLVDAIHYNAKSRERISAYKLKQNKIKDLLKDMFFDEFKKTHNSYISKLKLVINTKLYYLNKKLWLEAIQSEKTKEYLSNLGMEKINLTIYVHNYLKHIDIAKSKHFDEYAKMEEVLKELDE